MYTLLPTQKPLPGTPLQLGDWSVNGQKGYWPFNEGAGTKVFDLSGNGNTGTITNALWASGKFGNCIYQDGSGDYIVVPNNSLFNFTDGSGNDKPFTLGGWFNNGAYTVEKGLICKYGAAGSQEWKLFTYSSKVRLYCHTDASNFIYATRTLTSADADVWIFIVATYDGSKTSGGIKIYFNGVLQSTSNGVSGTYTGMPLTNKDVEIGAYGGGYSYLGYYDFPFIFARVLSGSEIAQLCREPFRASMHQEMGVFESPSQTAAGATMSSYYYNHFLGAAA